MQGSEQVGREAVSKHKELFVFSEKTAIGKNGI